TGHEMGYTFARVMNLISIDLAKPAVAAVGYSSTTSCVMPWAMDYSLLLGQLPGAPGSTDYDLTYSDLEWLATNREVVSLLHTSDNQISPGNIGQAITWVGNSNQYKDAITRECYENSKVIGPGDIIEGAPGAGSGQTKGPMQDLCGADNNQDVFSCNWSVKVVVYDWFNGDSGANARFRTKF